jgi:polysaccharide pyruvyl transferase WcaK-like protein
LITLFCIHPKGFNIGNDAIHFALRELVHQAFGRVVNIISLPATSVYESQARAGLTPKTVHEINRFGDGVIVGGGNLFENGEFIISPDALGALEPPLMLFSLSRGRVYNRNLELVQRTDAMSSALTKSLHRAADYTLVRDSATQRHLESIGCVGAKLGGCPTIHLNESRDQLPRLPDAEVPGTLISIRNPSLVNLPRRLQAHIQADIEATIDLLRARNVGRIRILCNDVRDVEFATLFQASRQVDYVYTSDVRWYLALLKAAKLVVSYRLHATLPAFSYGTPAISISYDERALSLLGDLGLGDWDINMVEEGNLVAGIENRLDRLAELDGLRAANAPRWSEIKGLQLESMTEFAGDVKEYVRKAQETLRGRST